MDLYSSKVCILVDAYIGVNRQLIAILILLFNVTAPKVPFLEKIKEKVHF